METNTLVDIVGIIERCQKIGVSKLKTRDFEVEFFLEMSQEVGNFVSKEIIEQEKNKPQAIDKELLDEIRMSQLMIDDPLGFEREILNSEQRSAVDEGLQD